MTTVAEAASDDRQIRKGTPAYRHTSLAMFLGGFSTFWLLYWPQPLLPHFARDFQLSPAASSAVLSTAMAALALALIPASFLADRYGRKVLMQPAMLLAALLTVLAAFVPDYQTLLLLRVLTGIALAGLPATAMAYLGEEIEPRALGSAMGLYIAGTALGGMSGRLCTALLVDIASWPWAAAVVGGVGLLAGVVFCRVLPSSRHFRQRPLPLSAHGRQALGRAVLGIVRDPGLPWLFAIGFLLLGCFVSLYNYIGFRLELPPFALGSSATGGIFLLYLLGTVASAWSGRLARRLGAAVALAGMLALMLAGLLLTLAQSLVWVVMGIALFTFAFFGGHAMASAWVGQRGGQARALAAALYLSSYYLGASTIGTLSGVFWVHRHWPGVVAALALALIAALLAVWRLFRLPAPRQLPAGISPSV